MKLSALISSAAVALVLAGCAVPQSGDPPAVPPIRAERIPVPPASAITQIWQPGHWVWDGRDYRWEDGEWVPRSGHGPLWQDGFWRRSGNLFTWVPAHWM